MSKCFGIFNTVHILGYVLNSRLARAENPSESDIRVYIDIEMSQSRVRMRNVAVKGWYRTVRSLPTVEGRREMTGGQWGCACRWRTRPASNPRSRSGVARTAANKRGGRVSISTIDPATSPPRLCSKRFTHSRATTRRGCEALDISAYDFTVCFRDVRYSTI